MALTARPNLRRSEAGPDAPGQGSATDRPARLLGLAVGLVTALAYLPGLGRAIDIDSGETVGYFVVTRSWLTPLFRQREFNNPPLFSFLEHIVYEVTGRHDVATMRVLPIVFAAVAVGLLGSAVARRWGLLAGLVAAAVLASNPMFATESRSVRGYSLLVLCALGSTLLLLDLRSATDPSPRRWAAYTAVAAAGLATHLFMVPVLLVHLVVVADDRRRDRSGGLVERVKPILEAMVVGGVPWMLMAPTILAHGHQEGRVAHQGYALDVAYAAVGGTVVAAVILGWASVAGFARLWARREMWAATVVVAGVGLVMWQVIAPATIEIRWFIWLVPVAAVLVAKATVGRPARVALVAVAVASSLWAWVPTMTHSTNPTPQAARVVALANAAGLRPCVENVSGSAVLAITDDFSPAVTSSDFAQCDVLVSVYPELDRVLTLEADRLYPYRYPFLAPGDGLIWSVRPLPLSWLVS